MSDSPSDPNARLRRNESRREPATIDLPATEVQASEPPRPTPDEVIPSDDPQASTADSTSAGAEASFPSSRPVDPPRRGLGFPALLGAGLLGGLLGAGAVALTETWRRPSQSGTETRLTQV